MKFVECSQAECVHETLASELEKICGIGGENCGPFFIGLSGGSAAPLFQRAFLAVHQRLKLSDIHFFLADERFVDLDDSESNFHAYENLHRNKIFDECKFYAIDPHLELEKCAKDYSQRINDKIRNKNEKGVPIFDLIILGIGLDAHTCSLFPNSPLLGLSDEHTKNKVWCDYVTDSPKFPSERVTLTLPILDACKKILFLCHDKSKNEAVWNILSSPNSDHKFPASVVCRNDYDASDRIVWCIDKDVHSKAVNKFSL